MRLDVFLDFGVTVVVPDGLDLNSDAAFAQIKQLARGEFRNLLDNDFDIQFEVEPEMEADPCTN
jgi:hypothetical protein